MSLTSTEKILHRNNFTHLLEKLIYARYSHDASSATVTLFKHLRPAVFLYSPDLDSNYRKISLWQSMRLDSDTQPSAQNTQSHKLVLWWRRSAEIRKTTQFIIWLLARRRTLKRRQLVLLAPLQFAINSTADQFFILVASKDRQKCIHTFNSGMNKALHKHNINYWEIWKISCVMQLGVHNVIAQLVSESLIYSSHCLCNRIHLLCAFLRRPGSKKDLQII